MSTSSIAAKSSLPGTLLDLEPPVVGVLRQAVLHHHHRADEVGALDVAHVVALDAQRRLGQAERVLQLVQRAGPALWSDDRRSLWRTNSSVAFCVTVSMQRPLVAPLRHPDA